MKNENDNFYFREVTFRNRDSSFKISTDSLLLADWVKVQSASTILDIGCGTGVLGILSLQSNLTAECCLVEQDYHSYMEAKWNCLESMFHSRLRLIYGDISCLYKSVGVFDHILCNPPYFVDSKQCDTIRKSNARHLNSYQYDDLAKMCAYMANNKGKLSMIVPIDKMSLKNVFTSYGWHLSRESEVIGKSGKLSLLLWEWNKKDGPIEKTKIDLRKNPLKMNSERI